MDRLVELFNDFPFSKLGVASDEHEFHYIKGFKEGRVIASDTPCLRSEYGHLCYVKLSLVARRKTGDTHKITLLSFGSIEEEKILENCIYMLNFRTFTQDR